MFVPNDGGVQVFLTAVEAPKDPGVGRCVFSSRAKWYSEVAICVKRYGVQDRDASLGVFRPLSGTVCLASVRNFVR